MFGYFVVSLAIFLLGGAIALGKKNELNKLSLTMTITIPFAVAVLVLPYYLETSDTLLYAVLNTVRYGTKVITMDINQAVSRSLFVNNPNRDIYITYLHALYIAGPLFASMFLISFSRSIMEMLRSIGAREVHVFSELNEKSIAIAEPLAKTQKGTLRVFCNTDKAPDTLKTRALHIHALLLSRDETKVQIRHGIPYVFYEIDEDVEKSLNGTVELAKYLNKKKFRKTIQNITVRTFVTVSQVELVRDIDRHLSETCPQVRIRYIDVDQGEAIELLHHMLPKLPLGKKKHFNLLLIGCGESSMSILRTASWLFQLPDTACTIHAFDLNALRIAHQLKADCPEFLNAPIEQYLRNEPQGKNYDIVFHPLNAYSNEFSDVLAEIGEYDLAVISLGDDTMNHRIARRMQRRYAEKQKDLTLPLIACRIKSAGISKLIGKDDGIYYYGNLRDRYDYRSLIHPELETAALNSHHAYSGTEKMTDEETNTFFRYVNYDSSFAQALAMIARKQFILADKPEGYSDEDWVRDTLADDKQLVRFGDAEHNRWNAYQRISGWCCATLAQAEVIAEKTGGRKVKDDYLLLHPALVPVSELAERERQVDQILTKYNPDAEPCNYVALDRDIIMKLPEILKEAAPYQNEQPQPDEDDEE